VEDMHDLLSIHPGQVDHNTTVTQFTHSQNNTFTHYWARGMALGLYIHCIGWEKTFYIYTMIPWRETNPGISFSRHTAFFGPFFKSLIRLECYCSYRHIYWTLLLIASDRTLHCTTVGMIGLSKAEGWTEYKAVVVGLRGDTQSSTTSEDSDTTLPSLVSIILMTTLFLFWVVWLKLLAPFPLPEL